MKAEKNYQNYEPGMPLHAFLEDKRIPLLQMQHLRDLDFPITRGISYERTVDEFLLQLAVNDVLLPMRNKRDLVILLDTQGALIREDGEWSLLFTPDQEELLTLSEDAPLYPVMKELQKKEKKGSVCRVQVPDRSMKVLVSGLSPFCILDEYCRKQKGGYMTEAEKIVIAGPDELFSHVPVCRYGALATVDKEEVENYHTIRLLLGDYIFRYDSVQENEAVRPLSIAVFGAPGAGKSFGVKQIAKSSGRFKVSSLNLSQYDSPSDLFESLHEALICKEGMIPLVFFDEFDAELNGTPRGWLKYFLAPMQDGEYSVNGKNHVIKGAVFVFAGATAFSFRGFLPHDQEEELAFRAIKGTDFVSRLQGILNIKGPNPVSDGDRSHIIRRAMLMREQILRKTSGIYDADHGLVNISKGMLSALLSVSEYRHGSRSLEFILDMSRLTEVSRFTPSCLPVDEQLDIHLDVKDFRKRLAFEQMMGDYVEKYAQIAHDNMRVKRLEEAELQGGEEADRVRAIPEMADWQELSEEYRGEYISQIYFIGVYLQGYDTSYGLRPVQTGAPDAVTELYGPVLEELAQLDHQRWIQDRKQEGWHQGPYDPEGKTRPEMVPYEELEEAVREQIRLRVRMLPQNLKEIGFELYRKAYA